MKKPARARELAARGVEHDDICLRLDMTPSALKRALSTEGPPAEKMKQIDAYVRPATYDALKALARQSGKSLAAVTREAIERGMRGEEKAA